MAGNVINQTVSKGGGWASLHVINLAHTYPLLTLAIQPTSHRIERLLSSESDVWTPPT